MFCCEARIDSSIHLQSIFVRRLKCKLIYWIISPCLALNSSKFCSLRVVTSCYGFSVATSFVNCAYTFFALFVSSNCKQRISQYFCTLLFLCCFDLFPSGFSPFTQITSFNRKIFHQCAFVQILAVCLCFLSGVVVICQFYRTQMDHLSETQREKTTKWM